MDGIITLPLIKVSFYYKSLSFQMNIRFTERVDIIFLLTGAT